MKTSCPTCGDGLQAVSCYVPDHGEQRLLMMDFCMDCGEPKRFSIGDPSPPTPADRAVDAYLLMERKAKAWDEMRAEVLRWMPGRDREVVLELMSKAGPGVLP